MKETLEVLTATAASDIATNIHTIQVFKQIKRVMRDINYRAKHGYFNIQYTNMDKDIKQYLTSIGYDIKTYFSADDDNYITLVQWDRRENDAKNT